jgi:hypothetical protein
MISVAGNLLSLKKAELIARLCGSKDSEVLNKAETIAREMIPFLNCKYCFSEVSVKINDSDIDFGFAKTQSRSLAGYLGNSQSCCIFAATLGLDIDRFIRSKGTVSITEQYLADAVASTLIESLCDYAVNTIPDADIKRYSAGYGDFDIKFQKPIINYLKKFHDCNISLTESGLMVPQKSVTAIIRKRK